MTKGKRRNYTQEYKEEAVKLVTEHGYKISEASRNLGVNPNLLGRWKRQFEVGDGDCFSPEDKVAVQSELKRLRKENKRLQMEREILKKAAAFFANESS